MEEMMSRERDLFYETLLTMGFQVTLSGAKLGYFWHILAANFAAKVAQILANFWAILNFHFLSKNFCR